jgi:hypothetical protein
MSAGPSFFNDVYAVVLGSTNIYAVTRMSHNRTEDGNAYQTLMGSTGSGTLTLTFNTRADAHSVYTSTLPDQTVTISNVVIDKKTSELMSKQHSKYVITGFVMESASGDSVDPVAFNTASGAPVVTYNLMQPAAPKPVVAPKVDEKK